MNTPLAPVRPQFALTDHNGRSVTPSTLSGKYVLVFFGFTHCRVVCPRALSKLSSVLTRLGARRLAVQPLYVTVDPERDSPDIMRAFLMERYPLFLGLTGTVPAIEEAKSAFRVFAQRREDPTNDDGYAVAHTAIAYLLDPNGNYLSHFADSLSEDEVFERLSALIP